MVLYSGLFSLGANFPEFHELPHNSGKVILGCCMKFDCGSLFCIGRNWHEHNISLMDPMAPLGSKTLWFTIATANIEATIHYG